MSKPTLEEMDPFSIALCVCQTAFAGRFDPAWVKLAEAYRTQNYELREARAEVERLKSERRDRLHAELNSPFTEQQLKAIGAPLVTATLEADNAKLRAQLAAPSLYASRKAIEEENAKLRAALDLALEERNNLRRRVEEDLPPLRARLDAAEKVCEAMSGLARYEIGGREAEGIMQKLAAWREGGK